MNDSEIHLLIPEIEYLDTVLFEGDEYPIPIGYDTYLKRCYGDYMELPSKEEREKLPDVTVCNPCDHPESLNWKDFY